MAYLDDELRAFMNPELCLDFATESTSMDVEELSTWSESSPKTAVLDQIQLMLDRRTKLLASQNAVLAMQLLHEIADDKRHPVETRRKSATDLGKLCLQLLHPKPQRAQRSQGAGVAQASRLSSASPTPPVPVQPRGSSLASTTMHPSAFTSADSNPFHARPPSSSPTPGPTTPPSSSSSVVPSEISNLKFPLSPPASPLPTPPPFHSSPEACSDAVLTQLRSLTNPTPRQLYKAIYPYADMPIRMFSDQEARILTKLHASPALFPAQDPAWTHTADPAVIEGDHATTRIHYTHADGRQASCLLRFHHDIPNFPGKTRADALWLLCAFGPADPTGNLAEASAAAPNPDTS
jgi:hypothetical protein